MMLRGIANHASAAIAGLLCALVCILPRATAEARNQLASEPPNIVLIFTDDLGYGDIGSFGAKRIRTPNIDRLGREGMRFTNFYVSQPVCTPSRASLLTGCYANRIGLEGALNPTSTAGIHEDEFLLSELCKEHGYATALFGKWHLGHLPRFNPLRHGFDEYFGLPYPNDCSNKYHPIVRTFPPLPLMEGERSVAEEPDQSQFTRWFTERSVKFIERNKDQPFFLYLSHKAVHAEFLPAPRHAGRYANRKIPYPPTMANTEANYREKPRWVYEQRFSWHGVDYMFHGDIVFDDFYRRYNETVLAPVRMGVGWRQGVNVVDIPAAAPGGAEQAQDEADPHVC